MAAAVAQEEQPISRTYQYRKVMKPMLERKRRARINRCLDELKELLVGALQAEGESVSRLEKADVLELTVRHLHKLRRSQQISESNSGERFRQGFFQCANEVSKYLGASDISVSGRLVQHLDTCLRSIESSQLHHQQLLHQQQHSQPPQGSPSASQLSPVSSSYPASSAVIGSTGLNILTTYTPPSSPVISSPNNNNGQQKIYYIPNSSIGGSSASSTGSISPIPAHYNPINHYPAHSIGGNHGAQQPLSLCTKDEPFDLSSSVWRPW